MTPKKLSPIRHQKGKETKEHTSKGRTLSPLSLLQLVSLEKTGEPIISLYGTYKVLAKDNIGVFQPIRGIAVCPKTMQMFLLTNESDMKQLGAEPLGTSQADAPCIYIIPHTSETPPWLSNDDTSCPNVLQTNSKNSNSFSDARERQAAKDKAARERKKERKEQKKHKETPVSLPPEIGSDHTPSNINKYWDRKLAIKRRKSQKAAKPMPDMNHPHIK